MNRIKLLLLTVLLVVPFMETWAGSETDLKDGVLTYTNNQDGGGHFWWYATYPYRNQYADYWGGKENCLAATTLIIINEGNSALNNDDIYALREVLANNSKLVTLDLSGAKFTTALSTDTNPAPPKLSFYASFETPWNTSVNGSCIANEVGDAMFHDCTHLQKVILPGGITKIGQAAFSYCTDLKEVDIPSNVTCFDWECFMKDANLISLGNNDLSGVREINSEAFKECSASSLDESFKKLTGVTQIGYSSFANTKISQTSAQQIITSFLHGNISSTNRGYYRIPEFAFLNCTNIIGALNLSNTNIHGIDNEAFKGCTGLTGITLSSNVDGTSAVTVPDSVSQISYGYLGNNVFAGCSNLAMVTVSASVAPTCGANVFGSDGTNAGPEPNSCEVKFTGSADAYDASGATGYMSYRGNSTFMALLTKTMDEDNTDYTVVPQRHADVILHRTFKEGWNTLALPFGSPDNITYKRTAGVQIFMNALHHGLTDFMIAAYRGLNTTTNTFYFLKYASGTDGLDEFEPILIKMGTGDITSDNKYTFYNVEVNYDANHNTEYTAAAVKPLIGTLAGTTSHYVDGDYNRDITKFKNCTYDKFYFTGTLCKNSVVASATSGFIQTGDYIIQDNNFYQVAEGGTYGLKGFRGWFKKFPTAGAKSSVISIDVVSGDETTDIVKIDANGEVVSNGVVYNINGQLVGTSLNGLSKGLYIVNGKKYVVK